MMRTSEPSTIGQSGAGGARASVRKFDIDLQRRNLGAAIDLHLHLVGIDADVPGDDGEDFLAQHRDQIGLADDAALVFEQDLQSLARDWSGVAPPRKAKEAHAALRPNSRLSRPFLSF